MGAVETGIEGGKAMSSKVENLRKRANELVETRSDLQSQERVNMADLSIMDRVFAANLRDDAAVAETASLSRAVRIEQETVADDITKNEDFIDDAAAETDDFISGLREHISTLDKMEKATDLVRLDSQKSETKTKISELNEVKRILGLEYSDGFAESVNTIDAEYIDSTAAKIPTETGDHSTDQNRQSIWSQPTGEDHHRRMFPESLSGIKRGAPMTRDEANHGRPNPNLLVDRGYQINCQSCVVAYEARLRGYDVQTLPNTGGSVLEKLSYSTNMAWIDPATGEHPEYIRDSAAGTPGLFENFLEKTVLPKGRYTLQFTHKGSTNSGHIISMDRDESGALRLYDPQIGDTFSGDKLTNYISKRIELTRSSPSILRVDNQYFNMAIADHIFERGTR